MHLEIGATARLVLADGTTVAGTVARSGQWGVHRLEDVTVWNRGEASPLLGHLQVDKRRVLFAQIEPAGTEKPDNGGS